MGRRPRPAKDLRRLGQQPARYRFFLNPYTDVRFTACPQCRGKMRVRKLPLVIHVDPMQLVSLNKSCRYCPRCDLLITHRDELEAFLTALFGHDRPMVYVDNYLVVGTEDRADWLRGMRASRSTADALECLHDFAEVVRFTSAPRWGPA